MDVTNLIDCTHQQIILKKQDNVRMVLAYHTLGNGTCFGGIRLLSSNSNKRAFKDALRLSEAMTYKLGLINENYGGCKATVLVPKEGKSKEFLYKIGEMIEEENGKFISAIDFGFEPEDAKIIREKTKHILAIIDTPFGQSGVTTAQGIIEGIRSSLKEIFNSEEIKGRSFAVQGLGSVGHTLAKELIKAGGKVFVADLDEKRLKDFEEKAEIISPEEILFLEVDVLCPCGPAYVINENTIPKLKCKIVAGGANCQLEDEVKDDQQIFEKGILMAPDYAINTGGVIQGIEELEKGTLEKAKERLTIIKENLTKIYKNSKKEKLGTYQIAKQMAIERREKLN